MDADGSERNMDRGIKMKKLVILLACLVVPTLAFADTWCMWNGTQGEYCQSDTKGYIRVTSEHTNKTLANNVVVGTAEDYNAVGYYLLETTYPALSENEVRDQEVWEFVSHPVQGDKITRTWTVRDLTTEEIDQNLANPMPLSEYYLWRALIVTGVITQQQAQNNLPQELIDAYQARDRLENP